MSIVYISHRLEELLEIADRLTVLRDGQVVGEPAADAVDVPWIVQRMTGRDAGEAPSARPSRSAPPCSPSRRSGCRRGPAEPRVDDVTFALRAGEIVGLYGLMGAGRTELLESLLGVHRDAAGDVRLDGSRFAALDVERPGRGRARAGPRGSAGRRARAVDDRVRRT